jgi:hypothetical protein
VLPLRVAAGGSARSDTRTGHALKDDEFAASDEKPAAAHRDRKRRYGFVPFVTLWVGDVQSPRRQACHRGNVVSFCQLDSPTGAIVLVCTHGRLIVNVSRQ